MTIIPDIDGPLGSYDSRVCDCVAISLLPSRYCSRKLTRTRRTLHCQCTQKRKYRPATVLASADVTEEKQLFVCLVCAERCWSHALELKATAAQEARHKHRYHCVDNTLY